MIPEAAIDAAAKVMQASDVREGFGDYPLCEYTEDAAAILEAAAPFMRPDFRESNRKAIADEIANPLKLRQEGAAHGND